MLRLTRLGNENSASHDAQSALGTLYATVLFLYGDASSMTFATAHDIAIGHEIATAHDTTTTCLNLSHHCPALISSTLLLPS